MSKSRLFFVAALALPACTVDTRGHDEGTLTLEWTIDGTDDSAECRMGDVDAISIHVETSDGHVVDDFEAPCEDFAYSIDLPDDDYHVDALLIDSRGGDVTTNVPTDDFSILRGRETVIDIDFPADSFL